MVNPGFTRWALILVVLVIVVVLVATATVVMAGAVLQPSATPQVEVEPQIVAPGDIVVVTGRGWPALQRSLLVVALSQTREFIPEQLLAVSAAPVEPDGTIAATFVFPAEVPWSALREVWVVVRPPVGSLQAAAHLHVRQRRPTPTPTISYGATPLPGRQQLQGSIVNSAPEASLLTVRPFDGSPERGVSVRSAQVRFLDGRSATVADLQVGVAILAQGWLDGAGTLLAEVITILEAMGAAPETSPVPLTSTPQLPLCTPTPMAVSICLPSCTPVPSLPTCAPTPCALLVCPPTACAAAICQPATACPAAPVVCEAIECPAPASINLPACAQTLCPTPIPRPGRSDYWVGEFYANPSLTGAPVLVREYEVIDYEPLLGPPSSCLPAFGYSVRWRGPWCFRNASRYRFRLLLNGGARLYIDGRLVLDQWEGCPAPAEYQADADLSAGVHTLELVFHATRPKPRVQLRWEYGGAAP